MAEARKKTAKKAKPATKRAGKKPAEEAGRKKTTTAVKKKTGKPDFKEQTAFWQRFNVLICSGVSLIEALELAADECENKSFVDIIVDVRDQIIAGKYFSAALQEYPDHFPPLIVTMIKIGERAGVLDRMLVEIAKLLEGGLVTGKAAMKGRLPEPSPSAAPEPEEGKEETRAMGLEILEQATKKRASDVHIVSGQQGMTISFRIDGKLNTMYQLPKDKGTKFVGVIMEACALDVAERRRPQDGRMRLRIGERSVDFRVIVLPTIHGPTVVLRVLDSSGLSLDLDTMGFQDSVNRKLKDAAGGRSGLVVISGPHGSGKTTTMYAMLRGILSEERAVYTIEDPVEYAIDGVRQIQIDYKRGLTANVALNVVMRQDPDILVAGIPVVDLEMLNLILKVASTGHLVFTHMDGANIMDVMKRFSELNAESFLLASSLRFVGCQVLGRKLCQSCKKPVSAPWEKLVMIGFTEQEAESAKFFGPAGCDKCNGGYRGRLAFLEVMPVTEGIRDMIAAGAAPVEIKKKAVSEGMITLRRYGLLEALAGNTSLQEVLLNAPAD